MMLVLPAILASALVARDACAQGSPPREQDVIVAPGVHLHAVDAGPRQARAATVVLIPGWGGDASIWRDVSATLSTTRRVIAVDPRSQGRSTITMHGNTPEQRARDLHALLAAMDVRRPVLVGWSQGVQDVAAYVGTFGDSGLAALVLVDAPVSTGAAGLTADPAGAGMVFRRLSLYEAYQREYLDGMYKVITHRLADARRRDLVDRGARTPTSVGIAQLVADLYGADRTPGLARITVPTLVIASAESPDLEQQRQVAGSIRTARFESIAGAAHAVFIDQPARFIELLASFLP